MQVKNALNWKIFVLLLCEIYQQYQCDKYYPSHTNYNNDAIVYDNCKWKSGESVD